jgi:hypothetical protein
LGNKGNGHCPNIAQKKLLKSGLELCGNMPEWAIGVPGGKRPLTNSKAHRTCACGYYAVATASRCLRRYRASIKDAGVPDAVVMALI